MGFDINDVQQARHLAQQSGWYILSGTRGDSECKNLGIKPGEYMLKTIHEPYSSYKNLKRTESLNASSWDELKKIYNYRCATCGSKEGENNFLYPASITTLQKGHKDPSLPLTIDNTIPPCQGFSTLGKRFIDDPRNKLFKEYVRLVDEIRPKFFIMENVSGILTMENGQVLKSILNSFSEIGYRVEYRILNAAEYGVPQQRERVIFIGTRTNVIIKYPEKKYSLTNESGYKKALTLWDAIGDLPQSDEEEVVEYLKAPMNDYQKMMRDGSKAISNHKPQIHNNKAKNMMKYIPMGKSAWDVKDKIPKEYMPTSGYGNTYARLDANQPGMTITRNFACISSSRCIHPYLNRGLTEREAARIQSYPDSYIFKGTKSDIHLQIGNSVPPVLASEIATSVIEMLNDPNI